jgi:hypothetical protein
VLGRNCGILLCRENLQIHVSYYRTAKDTLFYFLPDFVVMGIFKLICEWSKIQLHLYPSRLNWKFGIETVEVLVCCF